MGRIAKGGVEGIFSGINGWVGGIEGGVGGIMRGIEGRVGRKKGGLKWDNEGNGRDRRDIEWDKGRGGRDNDRDRGRAVGVRRGFTTKDRNEGWNKQRDKGCQMHYKCVGGEIEG